MEWTIRARGHPNITARHPTTFMLTAEDDIGPRADCVVGVGAEAGAAGLDPELKRILRSGRTVEIILSAGGVSERILAEGHRSLTLEHPTDIVVRKSRYICGRTVAISASKGAADLSRELVRRLRDPKTIVEMRVIGQAGESPEGPPAEGTGSPR
jgi:hypothetical protein